MRGILSLFRNDLNKFNNTGERMLDSIYHMTLKLLKNRIFCERTANFVNVNTTLKWTLLQNVNKSVNH